MTDGTRNQSSGIRLIPPLVYGFSIAFGLLLERLWPGIDLAWSWRITLALPIFFASLGLIVWTLAYFHSFDTPFDVRKNATSLITTGPFRLSRNPGYVALTLLYLAIGILSSSLWILGLLIPSLAVVDFVIIRREEMSLGITFGAQYRDYISKVQRWL